MANERTFLAWIRTSIGIMAFGFVVERFALFMKQISFFLEKNDSIPHHHNYSLIFGILLVAVGTIIAVLSYIKFKRTQKERESDAYSPSSGLDLFITLSVVGIGVFLIGFLIRSL